MSRRKSLFLVIILTFVMAAVFSGQALAMSEDEIYKNLLANTMIQCYNAEQMAWEVDMTTYTSDKDFGEKILIQGKGKALFYIPTGIGSKNELKISKEDGTKIGCYELFLGDERDLLGGGLDGKIAGMFELFNKSPAPKNLPELGYTEVSNDKSYCIEVVAYQGEGSNSKPIGSVCWADDIINSVVEGDANLWDYGNYTVTNDNDFGVTLYLDPQEEGLRYMHNFVPGGIIASIKIDKGKLVVEPQGSDHGFDDNNSLNHYDIDMRYVEKDDGFGAAKREMGVGAYGIARKYFTGSDERHLFTDSEKYDLYALYLTKVYNVSLVGGEDCKATKEEVGATPVIEDEYGHRMYYTYTKSGWCRVQTLDGEHKDVYKDRVSIFTKNSDYRLTGSADFEELIGEIFNLDLSDVEGMAIGGTQIDSTETETHPCYAGSGALGWVICPVIEMASGVGERMWYQIENYHLKIPAQEVFKEDGGVEQGWNAMRDIANTVFIILFLVVIFSQLTGFGIDNYGIKKILPKLIIVAILINLSWFICEIAVDLSNILGVGLNSMLTSLAGGITSNAENQAVIGQVGAWTAWAALGGGGLFLFQFIAANNSPLGALAGIGLLVLGLIITIVVAMLFLYLILVAREAGIVLSIILAPVAIVCFALPNTEKLAKKWFDLFKALLIVYPICGAMVGGGQLAGSILASIDNTGMKIAAMVVQVLPYFLVPTLLKNSLALMGNVGAKLSTLGKSLGKRGAAGAKGMVRNSKGFKEWDKYQQDKATLSRAKRIHNRLSGRKDLSGRQLMRLNAADNAIIAQHDAELRARNMAASGFEAAKTAAEKKADADAVANEMMLVNSATNNGANDEKLLELYQQYHAAGNEHGKVAIARIAGRRADTANWFMDKVLRSGDYSAESLQKVAKEISEGERSGTYRQASPIDFEYASDINKGSKESFKDWSSNSEHISNAMNHHVTDGKSLVGVQGKKLDEISQIMAGTHEGGLKMSKAEAERLKDLAIKTEAERATTGIWDTTKAEQIGRIQTAFKDDDETPAEPGEAPTAGSATPAEPSEAPTAGSATPAEPSEAPTAGSATPAKPGEVMNVREGVILTGGVSALNDELKRGNNGNKF